MKLVYKAIAKDGKTVRGVIEAKDIKEAAAFLRDQEVVPVSITVQKDQDLLRFIFPFLHKVHPSDLVFFTRQLASMLTSGLTLMQSLRILKDQMQKKEMSDIVTGVILDIEEGKSFGTAIEKYPALFFPIYVSLIKAGEASGLLDKVLNRLADNLEKQEKLKGTVKSALMYPAIVIVGMVIVLVIMMIFVVPQLSVLYESLDLPLPTPTKIVINFSRFIIVFWPFIIGSFVLLVYLYRRWHQTPTGELVIDDLMLRIPIFGKLLRQTILTEFTRTLGLLIGTGTLVVDSLNQAANVTGNVYYKHAVEDIARKVEKGVGIGNAMSTYAFFPPILVQMVKIGEETGKLDESLVRLSDYFEREVDQTVKTLTTALEPIIMIVLGIGVAFLIISIITPIYNLTSAIQ